MPDANSRFSTWRDRVARARVLIAGDVMLDRYWFGDVERISPEAPVPVVEVTGESFYPGGAASETMTSTVAAVGEEMIGAPTIVTFLPKLIVVSPERFFPSSFSR